VITVIAFILTIIPYCNNIKKYEVPNVSTTRNTVICVKNNSSISGSILHIHRLVSEESVYKYYYQLEDGGIKQGIIPEESTTIYFVEAGEESYIETVTITEYWMNNNNSPATLWLEIPKTTYKLHIPEDSITNLYEFDS